MRRANPYGEHYLDGLSLNPFEVLFVKVGQRCAGRVCVSGGGGGPYARRLAPPTSRTHPHAPPTPAPVLQVKERVLQNNWSFALQAVKYAEWMRQQVRGGGAHARRAVTKHSNAAQQPPHSPHTRTPHVTG